MREGEHLPHSAYSQPTKGNYMETILQQIRWLINSCYLTSIVFREDKEVVYKSDAN